MPVIATQIRQFFANLNIIFPFLSHTSVNGAWRTQFVEAKSVFCSYGGPSAELSKICLRSI